MSTWIRRKRSSGPGIIRSSFVWWRVIVEHWHGTQVGAQIRTSQQRWKVRETKSHCRIPKQVAWCFRDATYWWKGLKKSIYEKRLFWSLMGLCVTWFESPFSSWYLRENSNILKNRRLEWEAMRNRLRKSAEGLAKGWDIICVNGSKKVVRGGLLGSTYEKRWKDVDIGTCIHKKLKSWRRYLLQSQSWFKIGRPGR